MAFWRTPRTSWTVTYGVTADDLIRWEDNIDYIEKGLRTPDDQTETTYATGNLQQILNTMTGQIRRIIGTSNWTNNFTFDFSDFYSHLTNYNNPHNDTANTIIDYFGHYMMDMSERLKLSGIETGATQDQSASELLSLVKTVDGSGSGLQADLLRGRHVTNLMGSMITTASYVLTNGQSVPSLGRTYQWHIARPVIITSKWWNSGSTGRSGAGIELGLDLDQATRILTSQVIMGDGISQDPVADSFWVVVHVIAFG